MRTFFHLTPAENIPGILKEGLLPRVGYNRIDDIELGPAVFFFPSYDCVEDALLSWYGEISEGEDIALLELDLTDTPLYRDETVPFEVYCTTPVSPRSIKTIRYFWSDEEAA